MTDTLVDLSDPEADLEEPRVAHIVARGYDGTDADAIITEALVEGTPVEALCGAVFVPSRDPKRLPMCQACDDAVRDILAMRSAL